MKNKGLWSAGFTRITAATAFSIIGGEAMNLPVSLLVFEETQSTLLASLIMVLGFLPDLLIGVIIAPLIDRSSKKSWLIGTDFALVVFYAAMGIITSLFRFSFALYAVFTFIVAVDSILNQLAYEAWYPDLIPAGYEQKGYSVASMLYPVVTVVMSPVAAFMYQYLSMSAIFYIVALIMLLAIITESGIKKDVPHASENTSLSQWKEDILEGFNYIKREKGIRNIFLYQGVSNGTGCGLEILAQAFYQSSPVLTVTMFGFLRSADTFGRILGGLINYKVKVPREKRFGFTAFVYTVYDIFDTILLFLPFPAMLANRFVCGSFGVISYNIRIAAVMSYMPPEMRARVNSFFGMTVAAFCVAFNLLAGWLGQIMSYRAASVCVGAFAIAALIVFILIPAKHNKPVYEAETQAQ